MTGQTPPGWYRDPYGTPGLQRYWDGGQWTQATQPADEWDEASSTQGNPSPSSGSSAPAGPAGASPGAAPGAADQWQSEQPSWSDWSGAPAQGPSTPPPWQAQQGPSTPPPWQASSAPPPWQGPSTPPPWQSQQAGWSPPGGPAGGGPRPSSSPSSRSNNGLMWALGGGGALVVVLIIVVALFAGGVIGGDEKSPSPSPTDGQSSPPDASGRSPLVGTITDTAAGLSYAQLGGKWTGQTIPTTSSFYKSYGFTRGETASVQDNYNGNSPYVSSVYSGTLPTTFRYGSVNDLESATTSMGRSIESVPEPNGSYPTHTRKDLESKAYSVGGKSAWYSKFRLDFPQAQSKGWNWRSETVVFIMVDQGTAKRPGVIYISIPDSHTNAGDLELLIDSIKPV